MFVTYGVRRSALAVVAVVGVVVMTSAPAFAQEPKDPNPGAITLTGSIDFLNQYMFRGIRQNGSGIATWPAVDLGIAAYSGEGGLKSVGINFGTWNSLHSGDTGADSEESGFGCACGKLWYESDFYASLGFGFGGGTSFTTTYTAYTSPNNGFTTVKEIMFKLGVDDSSKLGKAAVKPYIAIAQEFDTDSTSRTVGQADGGDERGHLSGAGFRARLLSAQGQHRVSDQGGHEPQRLLRAGGRGQQVRLLQHRRHRHGAAGWDDELRRLEHSRRRRIPEARHHHGVLQRW